MTIYDCREQIRAYLKTLEVDGKLDEALRLMEILDPIEKAIRESENAPIKLRLETWRKKWGLTDEQLAEALLNEFGLGPKK